MQRRQQQPPKVTDVCLTLPKWKPCFWCQGRPCHSKVLLLGQRGLSVTTCVFLKAKSNVILAHCAHSLHSCRGLCRVFKVMGSWVNMQMFWIFPKEAMLICCKHMPVVYIIWNYTYHILVISHAIQRYAERKEIYPLALIPEESTLILSHKSPAYPSDWPCRLRTALKILKVARRYSTPGNLAFGPL